MKRLGDWATCHIYRLHMNNHDDMRKAPWKISSKAGIYSLLYDFEEVRNI